MRKQVFGRKFSRDRGSRQALFRSLIKAFIASGKIETTKARAKAITGEIDKIITSTKGKNIVSAKRKVLSFLANDGKTVEFLFKNVAPAFAERKSGFTKITYLPRRIGDGAEMARIEWVVEIKTEEEKNKKKERKDQSKNKKEVKPKK